MGSSHSHPARHATLALSLVAILAGCRPSAEREPIQVTDRSRGCFHDVDKSTAWQPDGRDFVRGADRLSGADIEALRTLILASRREVPDLLPRLGFTPESLAAHRSEILNLVVPPTWRDASGKPLALPSDLERLLSYDRLSGPVRAHLLGEGYLSTTHREFTVVLPGDPPIRVHSEGLQPGMLPWAITWGAEGWSSSDPAIPAAMRKLADPEGPCASALDGTPYWTKDLWLDQSLWGRLVGDELVRRLAEHQAAEQHGWAEFDRRFVVEKAESGAINLQPESAFYQIAARRPQLVDSAWWWNPVLGHRRTRNWTDFLRAFDAVAPVVERQRWVASWKAAGPDRHVEAHIVGVTPRSETMLEALVQPGWRHAGFRGTPEIEILLRRGSDWCGTIYLAFGDPRAFIDHASPGPGSHWFDQLQIAFHPNDEPPTYGLVDGSGLVAVRKMVGRDRDHAR